MKKTLMALGAAAATLAVSAVAIPAPAHAQRGVAAGVAAGLIGGAIVGGAIASQNGYYGPGYYAPASGYYGGPAGLSPLRLAAAARLGRLWLAGSQRPGLLLIPFTFIKSSATSRKTIGFQWIGALWPEKTFFSGYRQGTFTFD